jgi:hypothetical protein
MRSYMNLAVLALAASSALSAPTGYYRYSNSLVEFKGLPNKWNSSRYPKVANTDPDVDAFRHSIYPSRYTPRLTFPLSDVRTHIDPGSPNSAGSASTTSTLVNSDRIWPGSPGSYYAYSQSSEPATPISAPATPISAPAPQIPAPAAPAPPAPASTRAHGNRVEK